MATALPVVFEVGSLGGASATAESIDRQVSMIEIGRQKWVEEFLVDGVISMLDIQFDKMIADESDLSAM